MRLRRFVSVAAFAVVGVMLTGSMAFAADLDDGDYTLSLPGIGDFSFTIDSGGTETVFTVAPIPAGYVIDDDDPDKVAWKDFALSLEVEAKTSKVEGDYGWVVEGGNPADVVLSLPDGGSITVTPPDGDGNFTVTAFDGWFAFGDGKDWYVANSDDLSTATAFFKVEATADGVEIKAVDEVDAGFLNDPSEAGTEAAGCSNGNGNGNAYGRGHGAAVAEILANGGSPSEIAGEHGQAVSEMVHAYNELRKQGR